MSLDRVSQTCEQRLGGGSDPAAPAAKGYEGRIQMRPGRHVMNFSLDTHERARTPHGACSAAVGVVICC